MFRVCAASIGFEQAAWTDNPAPPFGTVVPLVNELPSLWQTLSLTVGAQSGPLEYLFDGFPKNVQYVVNSLTLSQLGSTDLGFLSRIYCAPLGTTTISDNPQLSSLTGLRAKFFESPDQKLIISNNPELFRPGFQPLGHSLLCDKPGFSLNLIVSAAPADCPNNGNPLSSVADVCSYLVNGC